MTKNLDWSNIGFGYIKTDYRYVSNFKNGSWDEGALTTDETVAINECAGVLQYAQTCFEGMKAYRTVDNKVVCFRPDLNAKRMADTCKRLIMPEFPEEKFIDAISSRVASRAAPKMMVASGFASPVIISTALLISSKPRSAEPMIWITMPRAPLMLVSNKGEEAAILAACSALSLPLAQPTPI